ncbi:RNA-directed DNA polymerase (Reverse transcriptase), Ribonuclease H-like protein [Cucumis melo var. makuwa]|uniref:RNA-directed DNA polymerase (Reverse transcriptase), Ribonuclease H-like protein n=1 Tax=Cucumis melo var. makuwa TaxID=1194695 RepID=A0A5D3DIP4_CUCMM|nr:RNA-directed DNA polymerase (Reverse transcriptase), Ribonuclease H-like protein [Cucumis melo var. makuwa]
MNTLFQILHGVGYLSPRSNNDDEEKVGCANKKQCLFHPKTDDHSVEDCFEFKNEETSNDTSIAVISKNTIPPHPLVYQCPPEFELNNWEIKKMLKVSKGSQKIRNRGTKVEGDIDDVVDFEVSICNLKQNIEEDEYDISHELLRLLEQEKKKTMSYQETLKVINLGTPEEVKEV